VISVAALVLAVTLARRVSACYGAWYATLVAGTAFVVIIAIVPLGIQLVLDYNRPPVRSMIERSFAERFGQRLRPAPKIGRVT
jgi:hypothetical protein